MPHLQPSYDAPALSETVDALAHSAFAYTHHAPPEELFSGPGLSTSRRSGRPPMAPSANSAAMGSGSSPGAKKAAGGSLGAAVPAAVLPAPRKVHHADDEWDCIQVGAAIDCLKGCYCFLQVGAGLG
jgi:hypothetical protein